MSQAPPGNRPARQAGGQQAAPEPAGFYDEACDWCAQCVERHPGMSLLVTFGAGFAVGALIGHVLGEPPRDDTSHVTRFGRQVLNRLTSVLPDSWSGHLGS